VYTIKVYGGMEVELPSFLRLNIKSQAGRFGEEITLFHLAKIQSRFLRCPPSSLVPTDTVDAIPDPGLIQINRN
jgi:hypothetical protein